MISQGRHTKKTVKCIRIPSPNSTFLILVSIDLRRGVICTSIFITSQISILTWIGYTKLLRVFIQELYQQTQSKISSKPAQLFSYLLKGNEINILRIVCCLGVIRKDLKSINSKEILRVYLLIKRFLILLIGVPILSRWILMKRNICFWNSYKIYEVMQIMSTSELLIINLNIKSNIYKLIYATR